MVNGKERERTLQGVVSLHVDDLVCGGTEDFERLVLRPLRKRYTFTHWKRGKGEFLGRWLEQGPDGPCPVINILSSRQCGAQAFREKSCCAHATGSCPLSVSIFLLDYIDLYCYITVLL